MALSNKQKQKKAAKKTAKRKKIVKQKVEQQNVPREVLLSRAVGRAASAPLHHCYAPEDIFKEGTCTMVLSRKLTSGKIAIASFLVDVWHKGIADCVYAELSEPEFNAAVKDWQNAKLPLERTEAAYVKKVILGAVAFAQTEEHQHQPHPDYAIVAQILEQDIDVTACSTEFVFGKEATLKHRRTPLIIKLKEDLRTAGVM